MDITWYGQACFRVKGKATTVVLDPFDPNFVGMKLPKLAADVVLVSHQHEDHNYVAGVTEGEPIVIDGPGEYEVKGVIIHGVQTYHDEEQGGKRGKNTVYQMVVDGVSIVHLGDLGHVLTKEQVSAIDACDVLMVPVGGDYTIDAAKAAEVVTLLEPSIVIPMHYKLPGLKFELDPVDKFLKAVGKESASAQPKLTITKEKLPSEVEIAVLEKQ